MRLTNSEPFTCTCNADTHAAWTSVADDGIRGSHELLTLEVTFPEPSANQLPVYCVSGIPCVWVGWVVLSSCEREGLVGAGRWTSWGRQGRWMMHSRRGHGTRSPPS